MKPITTIDDLVAYVERNDWVSCAEVSQRVPKDPKDDGLRHGWYLGEKTLWADRRRVIDLLIATLESQRVCLASASVFSYMADGMTLNDKNWIPVTFRPAKYGRRAGEITFLINEEDADKFERKMKARAKRLRARELLKEPN